MKTWWNGKDLTNLGNLLVIAIVCNKGFPLSWANRQKLESQ
jgi:hypothetical protein